MQFRHAQFSDIPQIMCVRLAVRENILSDPSKVTAEDCRAMMEERGRGWVCEVDGRIVGFAIVDLVDENVWALFLLPKFERQGIGQQLHDQMLEWAFAQGIDRLWLSTDPGTRAEGFYRKMGWENTGMMPSGELRFEMMAGQFSKK